jgi:hypothetical protein
MVSRASTRRPHPVSRFTAGYWRTIRARRFEAAKPSRDREELSNNRLRFRLLEAGGNGLEIRCDSLEAELGMSTPREPSPA